MKENAAARFERHRQVLVRHAYRMLGVYAEAEDVVQEAYLRWDEAVRRATIDDDRAFLRATVTRLALDRLRSARARREVYVGPWLPEPILADVESEPERAAALADDVSFALLLALERLSPLERAAFLLHDALDVPFAEIAETLGRSEVAVRRLASRAREHVREARSRRIPRRADAYRVRDAFVQALREENLEKVQQLLLDDVVFLSDGGGKVSAAINPVVGADRVGRLVIGLGRKGLPLMRRVEPAMINGLPGFVFYTESGIVQTVALETDGQQISAIYTMRNPDKLKTIASSLQPLPSGTA